MSTLDPYHVRYEPGDGMHAEHGLRGLAHDLEVIGTGLVTESGWDIGAPFVMRRLDDTQTIVGWIRPVEQDSGRKGVWQSWGFVAPRGVRVRLWPWSWQRLRDSAGNVDDLTQLIADLEERNVDQSPPPSELPSRLSEIFRLRVEGGSERQHFELPLTSPANVETLPWIWLLGPVAPEAATLAPPRRNPALVAQPFTYQALIRPRSEPDSRNIYPIIEQIVQKLHTGDRDGALDVADELRTLRGSELIARLNLQQPRVTIPPKRTGYVVSPGTHRRPTVIPSAKQSESANMNKRQRDSNEQAGFTESDSTRRGGNETRWPQAITLRLNILIGLVGVSTLLFAGLLAERLMNRSKPPSERTAQTTSQPASEASAETAVDLCSGATTASRAAILSRIRATQGASLVTGLSTTQAWSAFDQQRVMRAGRRIALVESCGGSGVGWKGDAAEDSAVESALARCSAAPQLYSFESVARYLCGSTGAAANQTGT